MSSVQSPKRSKRPDDSAEISYDTVFFTLSNPRRRFVLHHLKQRDEPVSVGDLATQVAAWENQTTTQQVTNKQRKRAYSALHQTHLPKMDELGVIEYDRRRGVVASTPPVDRLDFYLEIVPRNAVPWHEYYLAIAIVAVTLLVLDWLAVFPAVPSIAYGAVVTTLLTATSLYHLYLAREMRLGGSELPPSVRFEADQFDDEPE